MFDRYDTGYNEGGGVRWRTKELYAALIDVTFTTMYIQTIHTTVRLIIDC